MNDRFILLVEDDSDHVALILRALRKYQMADDVLVMLDGAEALDFLFGRGAFSGRDGTITPVVVLLDLKLPRISGLEVLQQMRSDPRTRSVPVVVLTSSDEESDMGESYRMGANSYIRKPVDFLAFIEVMRQLLHYWVEVNRVPPRAAANGR